MRYYCLFNQRYYDIYTSMKITVGIAQTPNSLELEKNFNSILSLLSRFAEKEVDLIVFPECSLSGFSSKMKECTSSTLKPYYERVQNWVYKTGIEILLPTAIVSDGQILNSGWWFKPSEVNSFYKIGLTDTEKGFFSVPEVNHSKVFTTKGFNFAVLICFEAEHNPWTYFKPGEADVVLWPGYWGWNLESKWGSEKEPGKPNKIFSNVSQWKIPLLQSNFSYNDLDGHKGDGPEGLSFVIDSTNNLVHRGPHKKVDGFLVELQKIDGVTTVSKCKALNS